jgi:hypothetical protein
VKKVMAAMVSFMKTPRSEHLSVFPFLLRSFLLLAVFVILCGSNVSAQDDSGTEDTPHRLSAEERIRKFMEESVFQSLGIISGVVVSDEYDTGMGFGGTVSQTIVDPALKMKTTIYFWGASRDSNDVSSLGIEETLLLEKSPRKDLVIFSGITGGYYSKKTGFVRSDDGSSVSTATNSFDIYLTTGFQYQYHEGRSFLLSMNYLITRETSEIHLLAGLEFFKPLKQSVSEAVRLARLAR